MTIDAFGYAVVGGFAAFLAGQILELSWSPVVLFGIGALITWFVVKVLLVVMDDHK
jgi:hypothetical protein